MSIYSADVKHEPYWWEAAPRYRLDGGGPPGDTDVVVVGSGYAGLNAALVLAEAGTRVVVIEAGELGVGASTRNGGAIGATLRYSFSTLVRKLGLEQAVAFYRGAIASREFVMDLVESRGLKAEFSRCGRFYGAHKEQDYAGLERDMELRRKHLDDDAVMVPRAEQGAHVGTTEYFGGRLQKEDGHLHPGLYHDALVEAARKAGVVLVDQCRAAGVERVPGGYRVETSRGTVKAGQVLVATNAYTGSEFGWFRRRLVPIQSQIIATEALDPALAASVIKNDMQVGDTCKLHNYYRLSPDGRRVLFGGRSGASQVNDFSKSGQSLHRRMTRLFPQLAKVKITHTWGGFIAFSFDHFPHMIDDEGIHYIGGCCGSGVAMMSYLGHLTGLKLLGRPYSKTFERPLKGQAFYTGDPWFMPAIIGFLELRDRFRV